MLQTVIKGFIFAWPFQRNWPVKLPLIFTLEAFDRTGSGSCTLNFVTSGIIYTVLNSPSNVDSEYVYFI